MQKLQRLEHENAELRARVNLETSERIDTLQDQVDDISRLKKSFETSFFETTHQLEGAQQQLERTAMREQEANKMITQLQGELQAVTQLRDTYKQSLRSSREHIQELQCAKELLDRHLSHMSQKALTLQVQVAERDNNISLLDESFNFLKEQHQMLQEDFDGYASERCTALQSLHAERKMVATYKDQLAAMANEVAVLSVDLKISTEQLRTHKEISAMQTEDFSSALLKYQMQLDQHISLNQEARTNLAQEQAKVAKMVKSQSRALARMTCVIDEKSSTVEELKSRMAEREAECTNTLEEYKSMHSVSNAEWEKEKQSLLSELKQASQERTVLCERQNSLTEAMSENEACITQLIQDNQALKAEVMDKQARITKLKDSMERLKLRIELLEKERAHFVSQGARQRSIESTSASMASQLSNHITSVTSELENLTREHQALQEELQKCKCDRETARRDPGRVQSPEEKKEYYRSQVRHLEQTALQQNEKRRELLLVNAKLVQEQKQLQIKNAGLLAETQQLKEKLNRSLLREERRRKGDQGLSEDRSHALQRTESQRSQVPQEEVSATKRATSNEIAYRGTVSKTNNAVRSGGLPSPLGLRSEGDRKRGAQEKDSIPTSGNCPPSKRRLSHFFSSKPSSSAHTTAHSKLSECNQQ